MKNITFITTGQPTTNPRLVKEADMLIRLGYNVKVIYCYYQFWAVRYDSAIIGKNPGTYLLCGGDPFYKKISYIKTRIRQKISVLLFDKFKAGYLAEHAICRAHAEMLSAARAIATDLYIAHNLGALPVAVLAARTNNAKVGYDAEDMNSGQFLSGSDKSYLLNKYIEEKYFMETDYFSAASPLIAECYQKDYPYLNPFVINNVFPKILFKPGRLQIQNRHLKLLWFSQTIGGDRGIEDIIVAMGMISQIVELHLWGYCSSAYKVAMLAMAKKNGLKEGQLNIHEPAAPEELLKIAAGFDIGMATETGTTLNRDICLTNKIFTYLQCGLALIMSSTQAQTRFMKEYSGTGLLYEKNNAASLASCLTEFSTNREKLYYIRNANFTLGQSTLNWEEESTRLLKKIEQLLN